MQVTERTIREDTSCHLGEAPEHREVGTNTAKSRMPGKTSQSPLNCKGTMCLKSSRLIAGVVVMENHSHNTIAPGTLIRTVDLT